MFTSIFQTLSQPGKSAKDVIIDFLSALWEHAKEEITREIGAVADIGQYEYCFSEKKTQTPY